MKKYVITELAASDLLEIRGYIAEDNKTAAEKVLAELKEAMQKIARNPRLDISGKNFPVKPDYGRFGRI